MVCGHAWRLIMLDRGFTQGRMIQSVTINPNHHVPGHKPLTQCNAVLEYKVSAFKSFRTQLLHHDSALLQQILAHSHLDCHTSILAPHHLPIPVVQPDDAVSMTFLKRKISLELFVVKLGGTPNNRLCFSTSAVNDCTCVFRTSPCMQHQCKRRKVIRSLSGRGNCI